MPTWRIPDGNGGHRTTYDFAEVKAYIRSYKSQRQKGGEKMKVFGSDDHALPVRGSGGVASGRTVAC